MGAQNLGAPKGTKERKHTLNLMAKVGAIIEHSAHETHDTSNILFWQIPTTKRISIYIMYISQYYYCVYRHRLFGLRNALPMKDRMSLSGTVSIL